MTQNAWVKLIVAGIFFVLSIWLGINGLCSLKSKSSGEGKSNEHDGLSKTLNVSPEVPVIPSRPWTIEDGENEDNLKALDYVRTSSPYRWEKNDPDADAEFDETEVVIYDESGEWLTTASVFVVLNDCAWVPGSAKYFKNRNETDCSLETLLALPEFEDRLASAKHLVFVGMESFLNAPQPASSKECNHSSLSECRADRLVTKTYNSQFNNETKVRPKLWELDIGYATTESTALEWYQRRALIIGIRNLREGLEVKDAVTKITMGTKLYSISLSDYSKTATSQAKYIPYSDWSAGGGPDKHR